MAAPKRTKTKPTKAKPTKARPTKARPTKAKPTKSKPAGGKGKPGQTIAGSLEQLARSLGFAAVYSGTSSGDADGSDLESLYDTYWAREYKYIFYSCFYAIAPERRSQPDVLEAARAAGATFERATRDDAAVAAYMKGMPRALRHNSVARIQALSFFDGDAQRAIVVEPFRDLDKRLKKDRLA